MSGMRPELVAWLEEAYPRLRWRGLAGDASTRRFWRILFPEQTTRIAREHVHQGARRMGILKSGERRASTGGASDRSVSTPVEDPTVPPVEDATDRRGDEPQMEAAS